MAAKPSPPSGLGRSGAALWRKVVAVYQLRPDELEVLRSACRLRDELARLEKALGDAPTMTNGSKGQEVVHPLFAEARQHRAALNAALRQLGLPDEGVDPMAASTGGRALAAARWGRRTG